MSSFSSTDLSTRPLSAKKNLSIAQNSNHHLGINFVSTAMVHSEMVLLLGLTIH